MVKSLEHLDILTLHQFPDYTPPDETGHTFQENATLKAVHAAKFLNKWVIADDTGLVVPSLEGLPGVRSRRYAGEDATDADNRMKLLQAMEGLQDIERSAYYECCLVVASPNEVKKTVTALCEGAISSAERGRHGFGYDSLFIKNDYDKTFAELEDSVKNRVSHRRKAIERLLPFFESLRQ